MVDAAELRIRPGPALRHEVEDRAVESDAVGRGDVGHGVSAFLEGVRVTHQAHHRIRGLGGIRQQQDGGDHGSVSVRLDERLVVS